VSRGLILRPKEYYLKMRPFWSITTKMKFFLRHFGKCQKSADMRVSELESNTTFQSHNEVLQWANIVGGFARL
jgi:hypothetical protein